MKPVLLILGIISLGLLATGCSTIQPPAPDLPEPTGYVVDKSDVLTDATEQQLTKELTGFDQKAQIAVVTVPTTGDYSIEEWSIKLADKWKVGYKGKDNGVILVIATSDRKVRIEVGRGLEGDITDSEAKHILDDTIIPSLKQNDFNKAVIDGTHAIEKELP